MHKILKQIEDVEGITAILWMIGAYGETIPSAPYILEPMIDNFEEESLEVKQVLLTTTMKLFFKRAPEVSSVTCHLSTIVMMIMDQFEDRCDNIMHWYVSVVSKSVYHGSNVIYFLFSNPIVADATHARSSLVLRYR